MKEVLQCFHPLDCNNYSLFVVPLGEERNLGNASLHPIYTKRTPEQKQTLMDTVLDQKISPESPGTGIITLGTSAPLAPAATLGCSLGAAGHAAIPTSPGLAQGMPSASSNSSALHGATSLPTQEGVRQLGEPPQPS